MYSHLTYDVVAGEFTALTTPDVLIVEGVNVLAPAFDGAFDVSVYVDADDDAVVEWFTARLVELWRAAADEPESFYAQFASWPEEQIRQFARGAWDSINAVNLDEHIRPSRERADIVVEKGDRPHDPRGRAPARRDDRL